MKRLVFLLLATTVLVNGQSTMRQGLFLHGYGSSGESWINTGTPTALEDEGVFTETISPDLPGLNHLDELATVINPLLNDAQNDDWIFIGHSLGGLMAKYLESATRDGNPDIYDLANLKGVLTLGAPFQGAPVADFEGNNTQEVVDHFRNDVRAGPDWQVDWGWTSLDIVEVLISAYGWVGGQLYQDFSDILDDLHSDLSNMIETAAGLNANSYIGPGGVFISQLNDINTTTPHLSISGVENHPASIRFAATMPNITGGYFDNEIEAVDLYDDVSNKYDFATGWHRDMRDASELLAILLIWKPWAAAFYAAQAVIHNTGYQKWKRGRNALRDIDEQWAGLHNGDLIAVQGSYEQRYWQDCGTGSPPGGWHSDLSVEELELLFQLPQCSDPIVIANGGFWDYRTVYYTTYVADKSDGFIPVNRTRWDENNSNVPRGNASSNGANIVNGNIYFDGHDEADGGYNHSELRNLTRNYGQQGVSKPMDYGRQWIIRRFAD